MTAHNAEIAADLACHRCGYNLRAHGQDARCPECGEPVAESQRAALVPRRPAWREADGRWRRRVLVGIWVLACMPLVDVLQACGWASRIPVPTLNPYAVRTLDQTFLCDWQIDQPVLFCVGVALLFSRERGRRRSRLEWTRRWGIICAYVSLFLSMAIMLFLPALVLNGVAAVFLTIPLKVQPHVTPLLAKVSTAYLRYGPYPRPMSGAVLVAFSSVAILFACVSLFDALRSSGLKQMALILVAPLALFSLVHLVQAGLFWVGSGRVTAECVYQYAVYFNSNLFVPGAAAVRSAFAAPPSWLARFVELVKWCNVLAIAGWLTLARFRRTTANSL